MKVISENRVPIKMWLDDIEDGALSQAMNMAQLPFVFKHIAIMPDAHQGYGMPIGGVMATTNVIMPNAVGVDIGCGMIATKTNMPTSELTTELLKEIMEYVRKDVPVGFNHHQVAVDDVMPIIGLDKLESFDSIVMRQYEAAKYQIGTLGGGNHFIEIQSGDDGFVWIMIHSGSRNLGYKVARYYNELAMKRNAVWYSSVPKSYQLAFLPIGSKVAGQYIEEMKYCMEFAFVNRMVMMGNVMSAFGDATNNINFEPQINVAHNYARIENHFTKNVWVHRKGATSAKDGEFGIIPGSQGTKSYIVKGKGNPQSFNSCSHGAGRTMGRKQAKNNLDLATEKKKLDDLGVIHSVRHKGDLDEAPGAYKDIETVMKNQEDLVEIVVELTPLGVIKG